MPIVELKEGQRLELEADAALGRGKDHAKHQGGVAVGYRHLQRVEVSGEAGEFEEEEAEIIRGVVKEGAAEHAEDDVENGDLVPAESFDNDLSGRYPGKDLEVEDVPNAFVFSVESDGSVPVDELVLKAVDTLESRANELEEAVQL